MNSPKIGGKWLYLPPIGMCHSTEVRRGMSIFTNQGIEVGKVAAIVIDDENQSPAHLLLDHLPEQQGYWSVPIELIAKVENDQLWLSIPASAEDAFALRHPV
jgi:sporulation protein YlmC with PRC-barrel domain